MIKMKTKEPMPLFCRKCENLRQGLFFSGAHCNEKCKYNPEHRISATRSFFRRMAGSFAEN